MRLFYNGTARAEEGPPTILRVNQARLSLHWHSPRRTAAIGSKHTLGMPHTPRLLLMGNPFGRRS